MDIIFTRKALTRLKERSLLTTEMLTQMIMGEAYSKVSETSDFLYLVVWDRLSLKPLLVIVSKYEDKLVIITIVETYENGNVRRNIRVLPGHIRESRARAGRFVNDMQRLLEKQSAQIARAMLRLELRIMRHYPTFPGTVIRKEKIAFKISLEEFEDEYKSDGLLLLDRLAEEGLLDRVETRPEDSVFMFLWNKGDDGESITRFIEQIL